MKYTHQITEGFNKGNKCFIYENIPENENHLYVRTEDNRAFWVNKFWLADVSGSVCLDHQFIDTNTDRDVCYICGARKQTDR